MMYLHYARHHLRPSEWFTMGRGDHFASIYAAGN